MVAAPAHGVSTVAVLPICTAVQDPAHDKCKLRECLEGEDPPIDKC